MSDVSDQLEENAQAPKSTTVDGNTVVEHPLKDQVEADRYLKGETGARQRNFGLRYGRFRSQGPSSA